MAFCCISLSIDTHCVHNPAEVWRTRPKKSSTPKHLYAEWILGLRVSLWPHLYLTNDISEPFAARVFALDRFVCDAVSYDYEDFGKVGVLRPKDDGVVAVEWIKNKRKKKKRSAVL